MALTVISTVLGTLLLVSVGAVFYKYKKRSRTTEQGAELPSGEVEMPEVTSANHMDRRQSMQVDEWASNQRANQGFAVPSNNNQDESGGAEEEATRSSDI